MTNAPLLGADVITMFNALVDDTIDSTLAYQLMNGAKDKVEEMRDWTFLQKVTSTPVTTALITLPTDFRRPMALYVDTKIYRQVPFTQTQLYANSYACWYLDMTNGQYALRGTSLMGMIYFMYIYLTPDITAATSPVWPARFHKLLAFEMAKLYFAIDQGLTIYSGEQRWENEYRVLLDSFFDWDASLTRRADENVIIDDANVDYPLGMM